MKVPWASQSLGRLSMLLFWFAVVWFGACWLLFSGAHVRSSAENEGGFIVLGSGVATCVGFAFGLIGLLPKNRDRFIAGFAVVLNGAGLAYVSQYLLAGL